MHTIVVITSGLVLLVLFCLLGRYHSGAKGVGRATRIFIPVWGVASIVNLSVGVLSAGYTVAEEMPIFLVVFGVPAMIAAIVAWRAGKT